MRWFLPHKAWQCWPNPYNWGSPSLALGPRLHLAWDLASHLPLGSLLPGTISLCWRSAVNGQTPPYWESVAEAPRAAWNLTCIALPASPGSGQLLLPSYCPRRWSLSRPHSQTCWTTRAALWEEASFPSSHICSSLVTHTTWQSARRGPMEEKRLDSAVAALRI